MRGLWADVKYAARRLVKSPGFTLVAVLSLSLGIGANTAIFSLVNGLLFHAMPAAEPDRLLRIGSTLRGEGFMALSYPEYEYIRSHTSSFSDVLAHQWIELSLRGAERTEKLTAELVSGDYFRVLGVPMRLGRGFSSENDGPAAAPVVVLSEKLWTQHFAADPQILGKPIHLNGQAFTVVGVAPQGFAGVFPGFAFDLWVPLSTQAVAYRGTHTGDPAQRMSSLDDRFLMLIARLKPDTTAAEAQAELTTFAAQLAAEHPDTNKDRAIVTASASGIHPTIATFVRAFLVLLMGIVGLLLLLVCVNLAGLLLARTSYRRRELAVRTALGAGRWRLIRQLLAESGLVSLVGGALGLLLAWWISGALMAWRIPTDVPITLDLRLDGRVLGFTLLVATFTAFLFGVLPALRASRPDIVEGLKDEVSGSRRNRSRLRRLLIIAQTALSVVFIAGAGLTIRSLAKLPVLDVGFQPQGVVVMAFDPQLLDFDLNRTRIFYRRVAEVAAATPGVESATIAGWVPMGDRSDRSRIKIPGQQPATGQEGFFVDYNIAGPNYFGTLRIPLLHGRAFSPADSEDSARVAIINETMGRRFWSGEDPVGKRFRILGENSDREIIGVAANTKFHFAAGPVASYFYVPWPQSDRNELMLHARVRGDAAAMVEPLRRVVQSVESEMPISSARTMQEAMAFSHVPLKLAANVLGYASIIALVLASLGLYGVIAYSVSRRTREFGIRIALGARPSDVLRLVVGEGLRTAAVGVAVGILLALGATQFLASLLVGVGATDPVTFAAVVAILTAVALTASIIPARRAARVQVVEALRYE